MNLFGGPEETHLAYLGVPRSDLEGAITGDADRDRRFNPLTYPGERDHFFEPHYELVHSWAPTRATTFTQTLFYFDGRGYYDEQRFGQSLTDYRLAPWATSDSTLFSRDHYAQDPSGALTQDGSGRFTVVGFDGVRKRYIENRHYGWVPRLKLERGRHQLTVGGEIRAHDGRHIGSVISGSGLPPGTEPDHVYYDYHPRTLSTGLFVRDEWGPTAHSLNWTADLAWRHQGYFMRGDKFDGVRFDHSYDFVQPRLGVRYNFEVGATLFAAVGLGRREPSFRDLYDGEGAGSVPLLDANGEPLVRPERVVDYELGGERWNRWGEYGGSIGATLFRMDFSDELVYAGQFNTDLGYPIIGNAARSVHQGVELTGTFLRRGPQRGRTDFVNPPLAFGSTSRFEFVVNANATLSDNHFVHYTEHYGPTPADDVSYDGNAIGFFPAVMGNLTARGGWRGTTLALETQAAGRIYLDNTESKDASIGPRAVLNLNGGYRLPLPGAASAELSARVFNLLDRRYATSGYMDYDAGGNLVPQFMPAATRHWLGELKLHF
jgi:iron complex outermembrane receptor protein